jgi:hypothetical protein
MHHAEPADTVTKPNPENSDKSIRARASNGNLIVETRYHGGFMIGENGEPTPLVLPFTSTGHTVSKGWMMLMNRKMVNGAKADAWAVYYRLRTKVKSARGYTWSLFEVTDAGPEDANGFPTTMWVPSVEDYERGAALNASLATGAQRFDAGAANTEEHDDRL